MLFRSLRNFVRRFCVLGGREPFTAAAAATAPAPAVPELPWKEYMEQQERLYVEQILLRAGGQVSTAHQLMGISRKSLYDKINKYGIELHPYREQTESGPPSP